MKVREGVKRCRPYGNAVYSAKMFIGSGAGAILKYFQGEGRFWADWNKEIDSHPYMNKTLKAITTDVHGNIYLIFDKEDEK